VLGGALVESVERCDLLVDVDQDFVGFLRRC
jgi:hypothetical protein